MDFTQLSKLYRDELLNNVMPFWLKNHRTLNMAAILPVSTGREMYLIQISLSGSRDVKYGCFQCFATNWRKIRNG